MKAARSLIAFVALVGLAVPAHGQAPEGGGMPDLRTMAGRPLPSSDVPVGTVSVRVARQMPVNGAVDVAVTATVKVPDGDALEVEQKTGDDGRASFASLPPGAEFQAEATVDGELLRTTKFVVPRKAGVRTMLIAGIEAPAPPTDEKAVELESQRSRFDMDAVTGSIEPAPDLVAGAVELNVADEARAPIANHEVLLAEVHQAGDVNAREGKTDAEGRVRFEGLPTGADVIYIAVARLGGLSLASRPFNLAGTQGMRVSLWPLGVTDDRKVLEVDQASKLIIEPREEHLFIAELLSFNNTSDKIFDPGVGGLLIPLPSEHTGAQGFGGGATLEVVKDVGILVRERIVPTRKRRPQNEAQFGYMLPTYGEGELTVEQEFPQGMKSPLIIIPDSTKLGLRATGMKALPKQKDREGNPVSLYELPEVKPGGTLTFTITGLQVVSRTGQNVAALLAAAFGLWALLGARRPRDEAALKRQKQRDELVARREKLFVELVALEQARRNEEQSGSSSGRRAELVGKLETIYRDLAAIERALSS